MVIDCGAPSTSEDYRVKQDLLRFLEPLGEKENIVSPSPDGQKSKLILFYADGLARYIIL